MFSFYTHIHTQKREAYNIQVKKRKVNHFTMKNEGWGFQEDQIPSSSHLLHQTMGSRLHPITTN
jgi:hypothetical protein